ncbi:MAG: class I SAM-dependent methyltransferase [Planctomycetales bacterium]|nr:class I SAM-dependent methyltransferase [Planctomycetales bacterium]
MSEYTSRHNWKVSQASIDHNRYAWNQMAESGHALTSLATDEELRHPLKTVDQVGWLPDGISGWNVLCLAAGGGRHGPLYAAAGGHVTVVDISPRMLERDRQMAQAKKLDIRTIESSMDDLHVLHNEEFDLVIHPVSTCYLPSLAKLFMEIARVTREGGLYISQHKQPTNLQASLETYTGQYVIEHAYYDPLPVSVPQNPSMLREPNTREFVHSWETLLGGICRNGFVIEDLTEPYHAESGKLPGEFGHRCSYIAPYVRIKARRKAEKRKSLLLRA